MSSDRPVLVAREHAAGVRLQLGYGPSLQDAADDLVRRALAIGRALRTSGFAVSTELPCDMAALSLLAELDEIAAAGGDVRSRLFGA
jgi:hypothetical protein